MGTLVSCSPVSLDPAEKPKLPILSGDPIALSRILTMGSHLALDPGTALTEHKSLATHKKMHMKKVINKKGTELSHSLQIMKAEK